MPPETITRLEKMVRDDCETPGVVAGRLRNLVQDAERLEEVLETREKKIFEGFCWVAQTVHQAHHTEGDSARVTWQHCKQGICAGVQATLRDLGYDLE
jgi:hypothetical protein